MNQNAEVKDQKSKPRYLTLALCLAALPPFLYLAGLIDFSPLDFAAFFGAQGETSGTVLPTATQNAVSRVAGTFSWAPAYVLVAMIARRYLD